MPSAGDFVKVTTTEDIFEGILMPRPEILDKNIVVLKLSSGYNIGIEKKKIKQMKLLKKYAPQKTTKKKLPAKKGLPSVAILSTGGTISSRIDYHTGGVSADYTAEDFVSMCPELADIANLSAKKIMSVMSEDVRPEDWQAMAKAVAVELKKVDGVVITHGTDTMHYTAAALSFFLRNLNKPVVITGAQRSIDRGSSDAFMNLICAVRAAGHSKIPAVMTCMHGDMNDDHCLLLPGTKVRKMHTSRRDAFRPINALPLGKVYVDGKMEWGKVEKMSGTVKIESAFESHIALVYVHPGMDPGIIDYYVKKGCKGLVLAATALGHVPTVNKSLSLLPALEKAIKKGVAVVIATQTLYGRTHPYVYTNLRKLSLNLGCIFAEDMLPETAYVKLGWILGKKGNVQKEMILNYAGEITPGHQPDMFLR